MLYRRKGKGKASGLLEQTIRTGNQGKMDEAQMSHWEFYALESAIILG